MTHLVSLGSRLTERDRQIALDCYEHHVLTTEQLQRLHFAGLRATRARLHILYTLRVIDRFRPPWPRGEGSTPHHWVLDDAGAHVVAEMLDVKRRKLNWRHSTALAIARSPKLRHHIETNEFFTRLEEEAFTKGGALAEWYGERTTHELFEGITPDGYCVLDLPEQAPLHILLELDRGTEHPKRLHDKATRYARAIPRSIVSDTNPLIILAVPTPARARVATEVTANAGVPITVAVWDKTSSALAIVAAAYDQIKAETGGALRPATADPGDTDACHIKQ